MVFRPEKHFIWEMAFWCHDTVTFNTDFVGKKIHILLEDADFTRE